MTKPSQAIWTKRLLAAVETIDRPGEFCTSGFAAPVMPGLEVDGVGLIALPLVERQAKQLKQHALQAAYGKGDQTIVDTNVRRVWRLGPDRFRLANPAWPAALNEIVAHVRHALGLENQALEAHLYDLLLYEAGGFFLPHRDGEKLDRMVATLVLVLPSAFTGGQLVVRHEDQQRIIDFAGESARFQTQYAAFYADCEHEVKPLTSGYRLGLVYNLTLSKASRPLRAPRQKSHVETIAGILAEWSPADRAPQKIALTLEHQYTQGGLAWDALKGVDGTRARILADAAEKAGCHAYLALLTFWESGSSEDGYDDYYASRGRRRRYEREKQEQTHTMGEVFDTSLTADHWLSPDGAPAAFGPLPLEEKEILPEGSLTAGKPEENFEGFTGNEGMTLERWYRRAAVVLWPNAHHFEILCAGGAQQATAGLLQMVAAARKASGEEAAALKERCRQFAEKILHAWAPRSRYSVFGAASTPRDEPDPLPALAFLDDPKLVRLYLRDTLAKDVAIEPGAALTKMISRHGWALFRKDLAALFQKTDDQSLGRNARLLDRLCQAASRAGGRATAAEARDTCVPLAQVAVEALLRINAQPVESHWNIDETKTAATLAAIVRALLALGADDLLARVVSHVAALPKRYPLQKVQMPVLLDVGEQARKHAALPPALSQWIGDCRRQLEALTAAAPGPPADFRREAPVKCTCPDCAELNRFLAHPAEREHGFKMAQQRRDHLAHKIRDFQCDLNCTTDRRTSPQILVCTKNTATHQRLLQQYQENLKQLAAVRALQPGA